MSPKYLFHNIDFTFYSIGRFSLQDIYMASAGCKSKTFPPLLLMVELLNVSYERTNRHYI